MHTACTEWKAFQCSKYSITSHANWTRAKPTTLRFFSRL